MPIRKDDAGRRWVEMEILLPGTPEQVWAAMATGQGNAAWFVRGEIEPRVGGTFRLDFGQGMTTAGEVTAWDPFRIFGYVERDWAPDAPPVATEIVITPRPGNRCVVRMVHSLFTTSDAWDDQVEGFESGWPGFFAVLRAYLEHFAGAPAASFMAMATAPGESPETAWIRLLEPLGLRGASVGERHAAHAGAEPWSGVVDLVHQDARQRYVLYRLETPSPGLALVGITGDAQLGAASGTTVSICRYCYGADAAKHAATSETRWREWLGGVFPPPERPGE